MKKEMNDLVEVSRYYGMLKDYILAGGGNTSFKDEEHIWIKASGAALANIDQKDFVKLDRRKVREIIRKEYSKDPLVREMQVKEDLILANADPLNVQNPSVETSFHEMIDYAFVVHLHPTVTNALTCSNEAEKITADLFGDEALFIHYASGYELFKSIEKALVNYRNQYGADPKLIFLRNHGIFVSSDSVDEIYQLYQSVTERINSVIKHVPDLSSLPIKDNIVEFVPALRMILSAEQPMILRMRHNKLHQVYYKNENNFRKVSRPFTPDTTIYCGGKYLYIENSESSETIISEFKNKLKEFLLENGYPPKIIMIRDYGLLAVGETATAAETALDVYEDLLKISYMSEDMGGPHFLEEEDVDFIYQWEDEKYRRDYSNGKSTLSLVEQKIAIITGGAQGFGAGIAEHLIKEKANVIIADLNKEQGIRTLTCLHDLRAENEVAFIMTDVADSVSVKNLIKDTVILFGGLDIFISNAGILKAGSLEEMNEEVFHKMTSVNYEAYFITSKYASAIMKLQSQYKDDYFSDIIQINSKSGLKGSNKNFAYAGAKFGGIGLTQSFAMELAPYNIKVNSICPGNFFEGPLWSHPEKGLFVQYLKAGKVPGAETIEDVQRFYEKQVPMKRGCRVEDVMKAILYVVDQKYETGQAIPVTGGQIMLN